MKVKVMALEVYVTLDGKEYLDQVIILGDEDAYDREVCVTYDQTTDINELKEVMKGWGGKTRMEYFGKAIEHGRLLIQMEAAHLPRKIGATRVQTVTKELDWI